jgi:tetratricopeptide (TPR) repeat protein
MEYPPVKPYQIALHELMKVVRYDTYKKSFQHILDLAGNDVGALLEVYQNYCSAYISCGKMDEAREMVRKARGVEALEPADKAFILLIAAFYHSMGSEVELSETFVGQALLLLDDTAAELYFLALTIKGWNCIDRNRFTEGIKYCNEIIENAKSTHLVSLRNAHTNIGIIYELLEEYNEAALHFQSSLVLSQQLGYVRFISSDYANLGTLAYYRFQSDKTREDYLHESIKYNHLSLEVSSPSSDSYFKVLTLGNLGNNYSLAKDFHNALKYGSEAASMAKAINVNYLIASSSLDLGNILKAAGEYRESLAQLEGCLLQIENLPEERRADLYQSLSISCNHLGLWEKAYHYSQAFVQLLQENTKKTKDGIQYHNQLLVEKLRQQENELHQLQIRSIQEKMQSQASLLVAQTDLLDKFRNDLRVIVRESDEPVAALKQIKEKLKQLPCSQIDWTKFESQFNEVHPEFRSTLAGKFPELTEMEQRIAVMVRMDLKSADIAKLFCITERAIEFHRLNMRKKLGLAGSETLPKFLKSI